ncbi:peptide chain release factor N(5)-glutamine methyltransferase [Candidatus Nanosynbacter featherlites]|jgi:protein-(glutamine-N5) methyltransferase, release factor-specific|uniref:Peptide chain release factor N(5)-glutamine methyltransferase n=1 Tax=Candidatus Nanosynbacter featherlites TaxID=2572088 RepID=A0A4P9A2M5_9BACT|nr:peptide chain release factor N(5)-glutamine methyltransferase [Candidatus Nanosynbacter featherlites]QCT42022.1 peptide chain release factor N(5)-glutamine methyltransferase [Candidatus Nanosynbacter featherlites]
MNISTWLKHATEHLKNAGITSAQLDAELLLANTLRKNRTYLHAHLDEEIDPRRVDIAEARLSLRLDRVPLAYILGKKEFYGREFDVSPSVLVPRPESEEMINMLLRLAPQDNQPRTLIDVGTGSGCLGITAALELSDNWHVVLSDISPKALSVAEKNAKKLGAKVFTQKQSLLLGQFEKLDCILANLPYVDKDWKNTSPELRHEPPEALYASEGGLKLIRELIQQAPKHMTNQGLLFIEADEEQHQTIVAFGNQNGFLRLETSGLIVALRFVGTKR